MDTITLFFFAEHSVATELKLVGLQIWRGALLLGDYILSHPEVFQNKTVLELGSGVGFDSIIAGTLAKEIICTGNITHADFPDLVFILQMHGY